eukprot:snap_masked-scaffold_4-processed-gene-3.34-mRNA-1 protein AED:1.00 eAED:1.00 QI:0/0/0/0/1/1/2/0/184
MANFCSVFKNKLVLKKFSYVTLKMYEARKYQKLILEARNSTRETIHDRESYKFDNLVGKTLNRVCKPLSELDQVVLFKTNQANNDQMMIFLDYNRKPVQNTSMSVVDILLGQFLNVYADAVLDVDQDILETISGKYVQQNDTLKENFIKEVHTSVVNLYYLDLSSITVFGLSSQRDMYCSVKGI